MKTTNEMLPMADCRLPNDVRGEAAACASLVNRLSRRSGGRVTASKSGIRPGFTLIELLVVISIMGILAGFVLAVLGGVARTKYINTASAELGQIQSALEDYKAKYGVYPPSNANPTGTYAWPVTNSMVPQLYYELCGVTNNGTYFVTLDGSSQIKITDVQTAYGVGGFINCSKGSGEEVAPARNFLLALKQNRIGSIQNNGIATSNLLTSVHGPDSTYYPFGTSYPNVNPFRYVYPGINNPNSYDLWVQLVIGGKTNLVCNWSKQAIKNSPLP
jgi:prepilin-type N-terminal cleavage/methylation domain-containing protein